MGLWLNVGWGWSTCSRVFSIVDVIFIAHTLGVIFPRRRQESQEESTHPLVVFCLGSAGACGCGSKPGVEWVWMLEVLKIYGSSQRLTHFKYNISLLRSSVNPLRKGM